LVLLIHGIYSGASSYEYRKLFPLLARRHRVVLSTCSAAGCRNRPRIAYKRRNSFVEADRRCVRCLRRSRRLGLSHSSLGAAFAIRALARDGERVERLAAICPTGLVGALDNESRKAKTRRSRRCSEFPCSVKPHTTPCLKGVDSPFFWAHQAYCRPCRARPRTSSIINTRSRINPERASFRPPSPAGRLNCDVARRFCLLDGPVAVCSGVSVHHATSPRANAAWNSCASRRDGRLVTFSGQRLVAT